VLLVANINGKFILVAMCGDPFIGYIPSAFILIKFWKTMLLESYKLCMTILSTIGTRNNCRNINFCLCRKESVSYNMYLLLNKI